MAKRTLIYYSSKTGFEIADNICVPGLSIAHRETVLAIGNIRIGKNYRFQTGVTLDSTNGTSDAPTLEDNVFLGDGCKNIGEIAYDVAIGANAVVVKSIH